MSPKVDRQRRKIVYRCDWLTCTKEFDTRDEALRHEVNDHLGYSATMNLSTVL